MVTTVQRLFLAALRAAVSRETVRWDGPVEPREWGELFALARQQRVLPMVYQSVCRMEQLRETGGAYEAAVKTEAKRSVASQAQRTEAFLRLYRDLTEQGFVPLVVKGIVCRQLYPNPDQRESGDEDLYVEPPRRREFERALQAAGLTRLEHGADAASGDVSYAAADGLVYLEVHDSLNGEAGALRRGEGPFGGVFGAPETVEIDGVRLYTLEPSLHILFLILHALKHFVNSGVGVRQVCDLVVYAHARGAEIDWEFVRGECGKVRAETFAAALFAIGREYLALDCGRACLPEAWLEAAGETEALLLDLLDAGIYGGSDLSRKHSGTITESAVQGGAKGRRFGKGVLGAVFLPLAAMRAKFPYLKKYPFLLPAAWAQRILLYLKETAATPDDSAADSLRIGSRRVKLLEQYGIIGTADPGSCLKSCLKK